MAIDVVFKEQDSLEVVAEYCHASAVSEFPSKGDTINLDENSYQILSRDFEYSKQGRSYKISKITMIVELT